MQKFNSKSTILVIGGSSYLGSVIIQDLLIQEYNVRATATEIKNIDSLFDVNKISNLKIYKANFKDDIFAWIEKMNSCDTIIIAATPNDIKLLKKPSNFIIDFLINGINNIFEAAVKSKVKKLIYVSCVTAIIPTKTGEKKQKYFNENSWAPESDLDTLSKSKFKAEKKIWSLYQKHKDQINVSVVVPGLILGPSPKKELSISTLFIKKVFDQEITKVPKISFPIVDVRDVSQAIIKIMENEKTNGERYLVVQGSYWWSDIVTILNHEFKRYGYELPEQSFNSWFLKLIIWWRKDPFLYLIKPYIDGELIFDTSKYLNEIKGKYRKIEETVLDFVYDMIKKGFIENKLIFLADENDPSFLQ